MSFTLPLVVVLGSMLVSSSLSVVSALLPSVTHSSEASSQSSIGRNIGITRDTAHMLVLEGKLLDKETIPLVCLFGRGCTSFSGLGTEEIARGSEETHFVGMMM